MFKNKISAKLSLYFAVALLIFAIIIGSVFATLFKNQSLKAHKIELENHAMNIARTIPSYLEQSGGMGGFGMYLRVIRELGGTDIWIVDTDKNLITGRRGQRQAAQDYGYADLPAHTESLINKSFTGETVVSEEFSHLLTQLTLTVGTPIFSSAGEILGVVLVHSPVEGINEAISQGFTILAISMILALIVAFLLSLVFSLSFTRPLAIMKKTALQLAGGNYTAKTNINQDDEIGELANTLDILADRLEKASHESDKLESMRQEFVANISHELRTPITVIRGSLEALVDKVVTDPSMVEEYQVQMLKESKFLQRLVGDLLELSKLQSIDFPIEKNEIFIYDLIEDVRRSANNLANKEGVRIVVTKNAANYKITGDYGRLRQMIMVILDNAIKFSPAKETVYINLKHNSLSIKDQGAGIAAKDLPYLFERFYKSRSEQNKTGTGLGLAIAKNVADRHYIKLKVTSVEGEGSTFELIWSNKTSPKDQI